MKTKALMPGCEPDALIAEKVMGWKRGDYCWFDGGRPVYQTSDWTPNGMAPFREWNPSTDIAVAWEVVKKMQRLGWYFSLTNKASDGKAFIWTAEFSNSSGKFYECVVLTIEVPHAICLAALKAVGAS